MFELMKKYIIIASIALLLSACTSITYHEENTLRGLRAHGISVDKPAGDWERPNSPATAGLLNILPGVGNFYLASGEAGDSNQYMYGFLNLLTWPISIIWGIPEAAIDAGNINKRELIYYYTYDESGREALQRQGLEITSTGKVISIRK